MASETNDKKKNSLEVEDKECKADEDAFDDTGWTVLETHQTSIEEVWQRLDTSLTLDEFKAVLEEQKYKKTWTARFGQIWWWVQTFGLLGSHVAALQHTRTVIYLLLEYLV